MDDFETGHILSTGAGISSPSVTSALGENPAGLVYNHQTKFLGALSGGNSSFNPLGVGGLFFLGNGFVGGGLGIQNYDSQGNGAGSMRYFQYGMAAFVQGINIAFGASGSYTLLDGGGSGGNHWGLDLGMIYNPKGDVRLGVTAFNAIDGINAIGVGVAADVSTYATFALDASTTPQGSGRTLKPAMGIHLMDIQLNLGHGIAIDNDASSWIRRGTSFGLGFRLSPAIHLQAYYNQIAQYYAALTIRM
jgi:hypothetical protein